MRPELRVGAESAACVAGAVEPWSGVRLAESHWWGTLRADDGWTACPTRSVHHGAAGRGRRLLLNVSDGRSGLTLDPAGAITKPGSPAVVAADGGTASFAPQGGGWSIEVGDGQLSWSEDGVLALGGSATGPRCEWSLPGIRYAIDVFAVRGTVLGRAVEGFIGFDQVRLPEGAAFYVDDPVARGGLLVAMFSFANRYADGTVESGAIGIGHDGWRYAFVHRADATTTRTTDVDADVDRADGYWPTTIDVRIDDERWRWRGVPAGRFIGYGMMKNPQSDGRFQRVGDDRVPVSWFAQGETVPEHGDRPGDRPANRVAG